MENNQQQILSEIKTLMASVRNQLEELDAKIALWQQLVDPQEADVPIELDFDIDMADGVVAALPAAEMSVAEPFVVEEPAAELLIEEPVATEYVIPEPEVLAPVNVEPVVVEPVVAETVAAEPVVVETVADETVFAEVLPAEFVVEEPVSEEVDDDLPFFDVPEEVVIVPPAPPAKKSEGRPAVIDVMTEKHAWRTAMPGSPVKDVRGAIALMDRVLFINNLFGTDAMAFQDALNHINQAQTLDEAVEYLASSHPEWDFDSDIVYSFMMAVRRKVN